MHHTTCRVVTLATIALVMLSPWASGATQESTLGSASFLEHTAAAQQSEIDLGQLAAQKAVDEQVKQFGVRMVAEHQRARQEVRELASKEGIQLRAQPSEHQKQLKDRLSKLSGNNFDRAYITLMLGEHVKEMNELGQYSLKEKDTEARQWAARALPVIKEHLAKAKMIASSLGITALEGEQR